MKRHKLVHFFLLCVLLLALAFSVFYFTRPVVTVVTGRIDKSYLDKLELMPVLTANYRRHVCQSYDGVGDVVISLSSDVDGVETYSLPTDPDLLFSPILPDLSGNVFLYYNEDNASEREYVDSISSLYPEFTYIPYAGELPRSSYEIERGKLSEGDIVIAFDYQRLAPFIRFLEFPVRLVIDYIDNAALESSVETYIVATPDWDAYILLLLQSD